MRPSKTMQLGLIVTRVRETREYESRDYEMDGSGEYGGMIARLWDQRREQIVRESSRTSNRWVHFNM